MKTATKTFFSRYYRLSFRTELKRSSILKNCLSVGFFILILITFACQSKTKSFKTFDPALWMAETTTCSGYRNVVINDMEVEFELFIGMSETQLIQYLGSPDKTLLYTRGQKFFNYNLDCPDKSANVRQLRVRFSALDYVNEVLVLD